MDTCKARSTRPHLTAVRMDTERLLKQTIFDTLKIRQDGDILMYMLRHTTHDMISANKYRRHGLLSSVFGETQVRSCGQCINQDYA